MILPDGSIGVRVFYETGFLRALLAQPVPRGMRCDGCIHWEPDDAGEIGVCEEHPTDVTTHAHQACVYWQARPGCGLDYMGVPLTSPAAQID